MRNRIPRRQQSHAIVLAGVVALAILAAIAVDVPLAAAKEGVHFDPDSPAGKEYALPLDRARDEASGASDGAPGRKAPLFGVGISDRPPGDGQAQSVGGGPNGRQQGGGVAERSEGQASPAGQSSQKADRQLRLATAGDGYSLLRGGGMVVALVLLGGLIGLTLRRAPRS